MTITEPEVTTNEYLMSVGVPHVPPPHCGQHNRDLRLYDIETPISGTHLGLTD